MDQTHIHLLITHLPIFGALIGALVLIQALWTKSDQTKIAAYNIFIISAIGAGISYLTGEAAEETVERMQGIGHTMIDEHEDFSVYALGSLIILGVASIGGIFFTLIKSSYTRSIAIVILFISIISFGLVARTGYLGGQIRHTEISNSTTTMQDQGGEEEEEDDD